MGNSFRQAATHRSVPVHPHVHGELLSYSAMVIRRSGSSPRAWGTLCNRSRAGPEYRFIPTCMGNSHSYSGTRSDPSVHPHVHGELTNPNAGRRTDTGSSPRAWGTRITAPPAQDQGRFIPTCMGNSYHDHYCRRPAAVHPHVHGELIHLAAFLNDLVGSSPRAWGTRIEPVLILI